MDFSSVTLNVDVENSVAQKIWLNLPSLISLDLMNSKGSPHSTEMILPPVFQGSGPEAFLLSSPESLLTMLSMNINSPTSPVGAPQITFVDDEKDVAEASHNPSPLQHGYSTKDYQDTSKSLFSEQHTNGEYAIHTNRFLQAHATMISQEPDPSMENNTLNEIWDGSSQMQRAGMAVLEEGLTIQSLWLLSQHIALADRASCLQQRVLTILGEHSTRHYSHQLQGLRKNLLEVSCFPRSPMAPGDLCSPTGNETFNAMEVQDNEGTLRRSLQFPQAHRESLKSRDLQNFVCCGHAVLHGVLESLDSDATVSSSDEEWDHEDTKKTSAESHCQVCEWRWLTDRAELCSRWTWLQMRLTELDLQIKQLGGLHQQILANKGHVVLAKSQPLTDRQIQHTLWTETMDLSVTAGNIQDFPSDLEMEHSSPTRLLRSIERQSAQLTQIVNSLMPPLCASPSSSPGFKGTCSQWRGQRKTAYSRPQYLHNVGQKRKRACHKRQCPFQVDITCVSARTRPLLTYHKPYLFIMDPSSHREQVLESSPGLCPSFASCDPATVCTDLACPHRKERTADKVHPVLSLSETPSSLHLQKALYGNNLLQQSVFLKSEHSSSHNCLSSGVSRSLFHCNHRMKNWRQRSHRRERTPIRWPCTRRVHHGEAKRKRHCSERPMSMYGLDDMAQSDLDSHSYESLMEDMPIAYDAPTQQRNAQFPLRRRNGESIFSIDDDIVIPVSLVASVRVEKLLYKDILTPSWRHVDISALLKREEDDQEERESEAIADEDFSQRHQSYEHREKFCWSFCDQSRRHSNRIRSPMCTSVYVRDHPAHCHPPVQSPVPSTWNSSSPEDHTEAIVYDREPLMPWKRRVFPLSDEEEEALSAVYRLLKHQSTSSGMEQEMTSH
ncbi:KAT8 regulatory NSL complex subunit 1-like protein isoform X2 [Xyrauchen texanus]|uniref:KAT8 regulatory NSL complex subunit 1-like protein isoform X2 n=1 Tax=Xyrauchen texanus TaxID=154827 RepID=UPI002241C9B1|nr:KAT8 regulatory NSL complex subunit 1-like protein isoform X2 [Xyrauchen texanus]